MTDGPSAYFECDGEGFVPTERAAGTWDKEKVHGRLLIGLIARTVDGTAHDTGLRCARLTVDLLQPTPFAPIRPAVTIVQRTGRSATLEIDLSANGNRSSRASAVLLAESEGPPGEVWSAPPWCAPPPDAVEPISADQRQMLPWDARPVHGPELVTADRKALWICDPVPLVAGEVPSGLVRLGMIADSVNPIANSGTRGLRYINPDVTLYLGREPEGEWFGFEVTDHLATAGIAVGLCRIYDREGPLGYAGTAGLGTRRPSRHRSDRAQHS